MGEVLLRIDLAQAGVPTVAVPPDTDTPRLAYEARHRPRRHRRLRRGWPSPVGGSGGPAHDPQRRARPLPPAPGWRLGAIARLQGFVSDCFARVQMRLLRRASWN